CYWALREAVDFPADLDAFEILLRRLAGTLNGDPSSAEAAHVLRVPKTRNYKYSPPALVETTGCDASRRYNLSEFDEWLGADPTPAAAAPGPFQLPLEPPGPGLRHKTFFAFARSLLVKGMGECQVRAALLAYNAGLPDPKSTTEVEDTLQKALTARHRAGFEPVVILGRRADPSAQVGATTADTTSDPSGAPPIEADVDPDDLAGLLDGIVAFIRRFIVLPESHARAIALWVLHTHVIDAVDITPYLHVTAGTKRSGKSRLLELLRYLVRRPWYTGRVTAAALARKLDKDTPTLLLDETDQVFAEKGDYALHLTNILNAGFSRFLTATLCTGEGAGLQVRELKVFGAKCVAGIGQLPPTVADRSIQICLQRKLRTDHVERARDRVVKGAAAPLRRRLEAWSIQAVPLLKGAEPTLPDALDDRAQDIWEPLLSIADLAGGAWPLQARTAALTLQRDEAEDVAVQLLGDIRDALTPRDEQPAAVKPHQDLIEAVPLLKVLAAFEDKPWSTWSRGEEMTPHALADQLRKLDVRTKQEWSKERGKPVRGYPLKALHVACARYLSPVSGISGMSGRAP
ncbi:MAG: DUF3631 domain-containing protein, partial [Acidobacteria bacterium]|nr:DUF3631 domain-containing protein [Acidobacteriota bacterium]